MLFDMKEKEAGEMLLLIIRVGFWWILVLMSFNLVGAALLELKHVLHLAHIEKTSTSGGTQQWWLYIFIC